MKVSSAGTATIANKEGEQLLHIEGDWLLAHFSQLPDHLEQPDSLEGLDCTALTGIDTAGAARLIELVGAEHFKAILPNSTGLSPERSALLETLLASSFTSEFEQERPTRPSIVATIARLGEHTESGWKQFLALNGFTGLALSTLFGNITTPRHWRITSLVNQIQQTGFNAVPIVALLSFMVGAVVAFLGATVLSTFGASIYTVQLVGFSLLRELGVMLTAILLAGRTASAFTAEIGAMKVNEEIDALHILGLNPHEILVLPRVIALLITLPMLSFIAIIAGLTGGAMVSYFSLDISIPLYLNIIQEIPVRHFLTGISKAPFFAVTIGLIGCMEGFLVESSTQSLGSHTTRSVVQSIFAVILIDALAAMFFLEMDW